MLELAYRAVSKTAAVRRVGSSPTKSTNLKRGSGHDAIERKRLYGLRICPRSPTGRGGSLRNYLVEVRILSMAHVVDAHKRV